MNTRLFNRFTLPTDGWCHMVPMGEFPWYDDEDPKASLIQVVDKDAIQKLANSFPRELFIDKDHLSDDPSQETIAQGWGEAAEIRADGLYVKPRWSEDGLRNVSGGNYRYVSPVFDRSSLEYLGVDERTGFPRYRVTRLLEAGLTNKPNMRGMRPLSNRQVSGEKPTGQPQPAAKPKESHTMKLIMRALDLAPDASEESAVAAIDALKKKANDQGVLANRVTALETERNQLLDAQAEADLTEHGITDPTVRAELKPGILANRATALAFLKHAKPAAASAATATPPLHNRSQTTPPANGATTDAEKAEEKRAEARAAKISNRARELRNSDATLGLATSYVRAQQQIADEEAAATK